MKEIRPRGGRPVPLDLSLIITVCNIQKIEPHSRQPCPYLLVMLEQHLFNSSTSSHRSVLAGNVRILLDAFSGFAKCTHNNHSYSS